MINAGMPPVTNAWIPPEKNLLTDAVANRAWYLSYLHPY